MSVKIIHSNAEQFRGKIQLSIDSKSYTSKPAGAEIGAIRNRLSGKAAAAAIDIETLANEIQRGKTIQGAILRDKQNENDTDTDKRFLNQQLFNVDIDNDVKNENGDKVKSSTAIETPEHIQSIAAAAGLTPCYIAESFSSGKKDVNGAIIPKYHVGFASSEPVTDVNQSRRILLNLLSVFGSADEACKDPARIIFGTGKSKQVFYNSAVNSLDTLLNCGQAPEEPAPPQLPSSAPAPKAKRTQSAAAKASGKTGSMSDFTRDLKENKTDPDRLLFMINPNNLTFEQWRRVVASYTHFDGATIENFDTWNRQYTGSDSRKLKQDLKQYKGLGKGVDKMSLHYIAEEQNKAEYDNYIQELISLYKKPARASKKQAPREDPAGELPSENQSRARVGELIPIELPFKRPENYVDFAFMNGNSKIIIIPQLLAENVRKTCKYIFVKGSDPAEQVRRFWYEHGVYTPIADEFIKNVLRSRIQPFGVSHCKKSYIEEAFYQLTIDNAFHADTELNADENIINFKNGLLHLDTMELTPHTPEFLSTIQIPCNYNPSLTLEQAPIFDRFITHLANDDKESKQTLLEYIGAAISNVNGAHFKKALFLKGAGNCGKSQYILLLSRLLSLRYFGSASLEKLESRFGKYALYNKRVVGDPDIKFMKMAELAAFKQITGGDPIDLESKGKNSFSYRYKGLLLFGCNQAPLFGGDRGQWVYDRMLFINCGSPIPKEEQDPLLLDKMFQEREAIAAAAIVALKGAIANRYTFTESLESKKTLTAYKAENDIVQEFIVDCCVIRQNYKIPCNDIITQQALFNAFITWARNCNYRSLPSLREFRRSLSEFTGVDIKDLERKTNGGKRYYIYTLTNEAKQELGFTDTISSYKNDRDIY